MRRPSDKSLSDPAPSHRRDRRRRPRLEPLEGRLLPALHLFAGAAVLSGVSAPVILGLTPATDSGVSHADGLTNSALPVLRGLARSGLTVTVREGARVVGSATAVNGAWQLAAPGLAPGPHVFSALTADPAGHTSPLSRPFAVGIDRGVTLTLGLAPESDTGVVGDGRTDKAALVLAGWTDPGAFVTVAGVPVRADATGRFRVANVAAAVGINRYAASVYDAAGNRASTTTTVARSAEFGNGLDRPPVFTSVPTGDASVGAPFRADVDAADPDGDALTYALSGAVPSGMSINAHTGVLSWTPTAAQFGRATVTVAVTDGRGGEARETFGVSVTAGGDRPPVIVSAPVTNLTEVPAAGEETVVPLDGEFLYKVVAHGEIPGFEAPGFDDSGFRTGRGGFGVGDYDASTGTPIGTEWPINTDLLLRKGIDLPAGTHGVVVHVLIDNDVQVFLNGRDVSGGLIMTEDRAEGNRFAFTVPDALLLPGANELAVRARDRGLVCYAGVSVSADLPPVVEGGSPGTEGRYLYDVEAVDPDGGPLTYSLTQKPDGMTIDAATGVITWTPTASANAGVSAGDVVPVTVRVEDGRGGFDEQHFGVTLSTNLPPAPPSVGPPRGTYPAVANAAFRLPLPTRDANGGALTYDLVTAPAGMIVQPALGVVAWVPFRDRIGANRVVLRATDAAGHVTLEAFTVTVAAPDAAPVITSTPALRPAVVGVPYAYVVRARDADGDALRYRLVAGPAGASLSADGRLTWTPGTASGAPVTIEVADGRCGVATQTFTLTARVDRAPTPTGTVDSSPVVQGGVFRTEIRAADPDGDPLTYRLFRAPAGMTIDGEGRIVWVATGAPRVELVTVVVTDPYGASLSRSFNVKVTRDEKAAKVAATPPAWG